MGTQSGNHLLFPAFIQFALQLFQAEMHHVVVVQFFGSYQVAETQPQTMQQVYLVGSKVRRVRAEYLVDFVAVWKVNFEIELRLRVRELLPRLADLACLLFALPLAGSSDDDGGRLQIISGTQNTVPEIVGRNDGQADRFSAFFSH